MDEMFGELGGVILVFPSLSLGSLSLPEPTPIELLTVNKGDCWGGDPPPEMPDEELWATPNCWPSVSAISKEPSAVDKNDDSAMPIRTSLINGIKTCVDSSSELNENKNPNSFQVPIKKCYKKLFYFGSQ